MMRSTYKGFGRITRETSMEKPALRWDIDVPAPVDEPKADTADLQPSHFGLRVLEERAKTETALLPTG